MGKVNIECESFLFGENRLKAHFDEEIEDCLAIIIIIFAGHCDFLNIIGNLFPRTFIYYPNVQ